MTTTVKVHVNGNYETTVVKHVNGNVPQSDVINAKDTPGGVERSYTMGHPAEATFTITERYLGETVAASQHD